MSSCIKCSMCLEYCDFWCGFCCKREKRFESFHLVRVGFEIVVVLLLVGMLKIAKINWNFGGPTDL